MQLGWVREWERMDGGEEKERQSFSVCGLREYVYERMVT